MTNSWLSCTYRCRSSAGSWSVSEVISLPLMQAATQCGIFGATAGSSVRKRDSHANADLSARTRALAATALSLQRALSLHQQGGVMAKARSPIPEGFHTVTPHLIFDDTARAIDSYQHRNRRKSRVPSARTGRSCMPNSRSARQDHAERHDGWRQRRERPWRHAGWILGVRGGLRRAVQSCGCGGCAGCARSNGTTD